MTSTEYFKEHGITASSIEKFGLDWNKEKITIPVKDLAGEFSYNKYRHLSPNGQKYSFDKGSHASLFNGQVLADSTHVFLVEGEMDCIRLDQEGFKAVSNTAGAGTFQDEWISLFEGKKVYVVYDSDEAGQKGAQEVLKKLPLSINIKLPAETKDICEFFATYDIGAFKELVSDQVKKNSITYKELCAIIDKWLLLPDKNVIKILLATLVSHFFTTDPLWMFFVAPPSGSKTEIISTAATLPFVRLLSDLTAQTFASGMKAKVDPSLLLQLTDNVLVMKDFTTVLTMRHEDRQIILSQLREIYDGKYSKAFGTGKVVEWEGRLTLIAGVTPIIDTHHAVFQVMGERFIMYRVPQANSRMVAKKALNNYGTEKQMRGELKDAMQKYFLSLEIPSVLDIKLPEDILNSLASLASFIVKARTALVRDPFKNELQYIPETEAPSRLVKQLGTLIKALAVLENRKVVTWEDYYLTLRVAFDIIPANRTRHIIALANGEYPMSTTTDIAQKTQYSRSGTESVLEDLTALDILRVIRGGSGSSNVWGLSDEAREFLLEILPKETKSLYEVFPEHDHYYPFIQFILKHCKPITEKEEKEDEWETTKQLF